MEFKTIVALTVGIAGGFTLASHLQPAPQNPQTFSVRDFPDLGKGLMETPGVLSVKSAILDGKRQTIFAWFKNKAAVNAWYHSKMHRDAMVKFFPNLPAKPESLSAFKDEKSPLLVVASVTPGTKPIMEGSPLMAEQIAIEIYAPVPGGITIGGGFGPASLDIPGIIRLDSAHK